MAEAKIKLTAEDATAAAFATVTKNFSNLKSEVAGLPAKFAQVAIASAGIASVAGFANMISSAIEAKARLRDLSLQTNISVEALASMGKVGKYSHTSLDDIAAASNKLSKALFSQNEDSKGAAQAIAALGLDFNKFKQLRPEEQMLAVAKALDTFQDGSEKSAAAMLLFGKQGAQLLPFLKELAERGLQVTKETTASAEQAKKYEDNLIALKAAGEEWKKTLVNEMLPSLLEFSNKLIDGRKAYGEWFDFIADIGTRNPFKSVQENLADTRDELDKFQKRVDKNEALPGFLKKLLGADDKQDFAEYKAELESRLKYYKSAQAREALALGEGVAPDPRTRVRKEKLVLPDANAGDARALLKKQFDGQLKLIHDFAEQQKDGYEFANQYLKGVYDDGVLSLGDFFERQKAVRAAGLAAQVKALDDEIAAAQAFKAKASKPEDRQEAENKIAEAVQKRARLVQKSSQEDIVASQEEAKAVKQLAYSYYDFLGNLKSLQGDAGGASELRVAKQIQEAQELLTKVGFDPAEAKAKSEAFGQLLRQTEALSRAQSDYARLVETAGVKEKNIQLDAQAAGQSELETLKQIGAVRTEALTALGEQVKAAVAFAEAVGSPEALLAAQKLSLQFKQAAAEAEPLFLKIRDIGREAGESIANDAEQAVLHWEGVRKLLGAIEQDIVRIATRKLFTEPLGNYLTNQIGGNGQSSGGGGLLGSLGKYFGFGGGGTGATTGGFGTGSAFGNLDFGGFFADGGTLNPGHWGIAGENGPEPIYAGVTPLHVTPNSDGQHITISQQFAITGPIDKRTQDQIAMAAMSGAQRALRRNG